MAKIDEITNAIVFLISEQSSYMTGSILTVDGGGDNCNASVSIAKKNKSLEEISRSSNCNIGRMYRYATLILGMRPADHEYKLMGLAAYNSEKYGKDISR